MTKKNPDFLPFQPAEKAAPCVFVILGATGDLARRKLLPAIFQLVRDGLLPDTVSIVGAAGSTLSDLEFRARTFDAIKEFARVAPPEDREIDHFVSTIHYQPINFRDRATFLKLKKLLDQLEEKGDIPQKRIYYLATPPSFYPDIIDHLGELGLAKKGEGRWPRVVIEKPFGRDLASALDLNDRILSVFEENRVFRIDHYLGKETVQNLMVLRFANGIFEPTWNRRYVDHVQITVAETLGVGSRGRYYEEAGVLRDMVQNHLLQLLALTAMEPPTSFHAEAIRDEKVKVLRSIRPITPDQVSTEVVRGQYAAGYMAGEKVRGYLQEDNVAPASMTDTFLAIKVHIENWRWAGVPFYLRSGKRLPKRVSEIAIQYREVPHMLFRDVLTDPLEPSCLVVRIQPDEGLSLSFSAKHPGMAMDIRNQALSFNYYDAYGDRAPDAYERLLLDLVLGDATLFPRTDGVIASWKFVDQIAEGWKKSRARTLPQYDPGSWGPHEAVEMLAAEHRKWRRPLTKGL